LAQAILAQGLMRLEAARCSFQFHGLVQAPHTMPRGFCLLVATCLVGPLSGYAQQVKETCKEKDGVRGACSANHRAGTEHVLLQRGSHSSKSLELQKMGGVASLGQLEQYLAARAVSGGQLLPTETAAIDNITLALRNVTLPELNSSRDEDVRELQRIAGFAAACDSNLAEARDGDGGFMEKESATNSSRLAHADCRRNQSVLIAENQTRWLDFEAFHHSLEVPTVASLPAFGSPDVDDFFEANEYEEWLLQIRPQYFTHRGLSRNASAALEQKATICINAQEVFEHAFCAYADSVHAASKQYNLCHDNATHALQEAVDDIEAATKGRKATYAAVMKILCYTTVLQLRSEEQPGKLAECSNMTIDADFLNITAPEPGAPVAVVPPAHKPGDGAWAAAEYAAAPLTDLVGLTETCHPAPASAEPTTTTRAATTTIEATTTAIPTFQFTPPPPGKCDHYFDDCFQKDGRYCDGQDCQQMDMVARYRCGGRNVCVCECLWDDGFYHHYR